MPKLRARSLGLLPDSFSSAAGGGRHVPEDYRLTEEFVRLLHEKGHAHHFLIDGHAAKLTIGAMAVILIVNDDVTSLYALTRVMQQAGFVVREARTCQEALQQLSSYTDLIVLDVYLPDGSGLDLCRQLKANSMLKTIPILAVSAVQPLVNESRQAGADAFLGLPADRQALVGEVQGLLARGQA